MYKPRRSKYFVLRCEGVIHSIARKYVDATLVYLDDCPDMEIKKDDEHEVRMPISLFCDNAIARDSIKKGFSFYLYVRVKNKTKTVLIEQRQFPPITARVRAKIRYKMKGYCQILHGDNWKTVWAEWKKEGVPHI